MEDPDNQIYAVDYNQDGTQLATAGRDTAVRIYDEGTKQLVTCMRGGTGYSIHATPGHSNRVFSLRYHPDDQRSEESRVGKVCVRTFSSRWSPYHTKTKQ